MKEGMLEQRKKFINQRKIELQQRKTLLNPEQDCEEENLFLELAEDEATPDTRILQIVREIPHQQEDEGTMSNSCSTGTSTQTCSVGTSTSMTSTGVQVVNVLFWQP